MPPPCPESGAVNIHHRDFNVTQRPCRRTFLPHTVLLSRWGSLGRHEVHRADGAGAHRVREQLEASGCPVVQFRSPSVAAFASSGITCTDIDADLNTVVSNLKTQDAKFQEAWVSGGDSADLQSLI